MSVVPKSELDQIATNITAKTINHLFFLNGTLVFDMAIVKFIDVVTEA